MITITTDKSLITQGDVIKIQVQVKNQDGEPVDLSKSCRKFTGGTAVGSFIAGERVRQAVTGYQGYYIADDEEGSIYLRDISGEADSENELSGRESLAEYVPAGQVATQSSVHFNAYSELTGELIIANEELIPVNAGLGIFETSLQETAEWPLGLYILRATIAQPMGAETQSENSREDHLVVRS